MNSKKRYEQEQHDYREAYFEYQQSILKEEMGTIERTIARLDGAINSNKNWAILVWAGSLSILLQDQFLNDYILFTVAIPILFWLTAARAYYHQNAAIYRQSKISEYLNSEKLEQSFREKRFVDFTILDVMGMQYHKTEEYRQAVNYWKMLTYKSLSILFGGMILVSVAVWLLLAVFSP